MSPLKTTDHGLPREGSGGGFTRREALQIIAAQMTFALAACSKPEEEIVPYVRMPERLVPGEPLRFATALPLGGFGRGIVAISVDGRPIKIEGNTRHPASLGATDAFAEAEVLTLYDPDRSKTPTEQGHLSSWNMFLAALQPQLEQHGKNGGDGLRLLTGRTTSPTLLRQIAVFLSRYPGAIWHVHEPISDEEEQEGAKLAFGRPLQLVPQFDRAKVLLALDADPLGPGPNQIRNGRQWIEARDAREPASFSRCYVAEAALSLSGAKADHRLAVHPSTISNIAISVANILGADLPHPSLPAEAVRFVNACARDLIDHPSRALVLAGRTQTREVHALVHWINAKLNAPVDFIELFDRPMGHDPHSLTALAQDLNAGQVQTIVIVDANPVYDAPADVSIVEALKKAQFSVHLGSHRDETAALCRWHLPQSHPLESWSDLRAVDGTAAIVQPLIRPLYASRTAHELMSILVGQNDAAAYDLVRDTWRPTGGAAFDDWWRQTLHEGVVAGSASKPTPTEAPRLPDIKPFENNAGFSLVLSPDASAWDGRFANSPWLQECPKPISKEVWGNALSIGADDAGRLGLASGDVVRISVKDRSIQVPVLVAPGSAPGVVNLTLGYGRGAAGNIGNGVGVDAYRLRTAETPWVIASVTLARTGERRDVLTTQNYVRLEGEVRELYPALSLSELASGTRVAKSEAPPTLYPPFQYDTYAWSMLIDTAACVGCNACVIACQAENNVPVVGPEEIARGRDMHWLRVDIYDLGTAQAPKPGFQPVPCMHCEQAPCEPVCPVAASVHDGEGLNVQVYNRCVGTRFCQANCPYKVRRFNFFGYADGQEYANLGAETTRAQHNPDVSTRQRGVMEKCTYCVQRISRARRSAKRDDRTITDGEVVTACQAACPTRAITFGDLHTPDAAVRRDKENPRHYALLAHLDTRPRTTYLADVRNSNPELQGEGP